jgi:acyl-coenzyme A synthetase/AMP-(fatty) acid ligase
MFNLNHVLAARPAALVAGWREGAVVSHGVWLMRAACWRRLLEQTPGRNFALYLSDSLEFGAALLGAWQAGKTIWLSADTLAASCAALALSVDGFLGEFPARYQPLQPDGAAEPTPAPPPPIAFSPDFAALVVYTSGTTGAPQAIPKKLSQLLTEAATLEALFGPLLGSAEVVATVSHQHIYGLLFKVLWPLMAGRAIHALSQNFPEQLAQTLALRPCVLIASPAHLKRLPDHLAWNDAAVCLRAVFSSGGPLPLEVADITAQLLGQTPIEVYGSSETGGVAWRQRTAGADDAWRAMPQVAWRVADDDADAAVTDDAVGHLLEVRSPHLPDDGWLRLADRVQPQADGRFLLHGRSDRIVKIEEKRISLDAIEVLLLASALVSAARILVCDAEPGERQRLAAFVVLSATGRRVLADSGKLVLNRQLRDVLAAAVEPVALPRRWRYLDRMPHDAQGKTTRALLQALLDAPDAAPRTPSVRLLERTALRVALELIAPPALLYFDGHFPQAPILPGVVQVDWAIAHGRHYFDLPPQFRAMHALKFQNVIRPDYPVTLELVHDEQKGSLNFRYFSAAGQHASGRLLFGAASV